MLVYFTGIDTDKQCGPLSNVDFVQFVRENFLRFSYKKFAMSLSSHGTIKLHKLLCLKYYRAESEGWKDHANLMIVSSVTLLFWIPKTLAHAYPTNDLVNCVGINLLPWQIPPDTFYSITLFIWTGLNLLMKRHTINTYMLFARTECLRIIFYHQRPLLYEFGFVTE